MTAIAIHHAATRAEMAGAAPATENQIKFLSSLMESREHDYSAEVYSSNFLLTSSKASRMIDDLLQSPMAKAKPEPTPEEVEPKVNRSLMRDEIRSAGYFVGDRVEVRRGFTWVAATVVSGGGILTVTLDEREGKIKIKRLDDIRRI